VFWGSNGNQRPVFLFSTPEQLSVPYRICRDI
jgi:hypothetical protein